MKDNLHNVHPLLAAVVRRAWRHQIVKFMIGEPEDEMTVNLIPLNVEGEESEIIAFGMIAALMLQSANEVGCEIEWLWKADKTYLNMMRYRLKDV